MMPLSLIPLSWKIGACIALVASLAAGGAIYHHHVYQAGFDDAVAQRAASDAVAVQRRLDDNAKLAGKQESTNATITKVKNEELAPVVRTIYVDRVRVGAASCGPTAAAKAESTTSSNSSDSSGRLVREDVERDTRALTEAVEQDLATGRACQAFIKENGFIP